MAYSALRLQFLSLENSYPVFLAFLFPFSLTVDEILALQTELEIATGEERTETIMDTEVFVAEMLNSDEPVSA